MAPGFLFGFVVTSSDSKWSPAVVVYLRTRNQSGRTRSRTWSNAVITRPVRSFKLSQRGYPEDGDLRPIIIVRGYSVVNTS